MLLKKCKWLTFRILKLLTILIVNIYYYKSTIYMNENELLNKTFEQLKEKGILNYFQARFISSVAQVVENSDISCLKPYRNLYDSVADEIASQIVVQFFLKHNLNLTMSTANYEYPDFLKIRDLSILSALKIRDMDSSSFTSNPLHSLLNSWKEMKDTVVLLNKQKMRKEIKERLEYIEKIDEQRQSVLNEPKKKNELNKVHFDNNIEEAKDSKIQIKKSSFNDNMNLYQRIDDEDDFDTQIERQLLSLSSTSLNTNDNNKFKKQSSDEDEIITTSSFNLSNLDIQQRSVSEPSLINTASPTKSPPNEEIKKFFQKDTNNLKRKKREVVTLIPMRSADLKGYDDTKTAFITKVQTLDYLESSSSSDGFFESDTSKRENVQFDIDLDDNYNHKKVNSSKVDKKKDIETDSDEFDDF